MAAVEFVIRTIFLLSTQQPLPSEHALNTYSQPSQYGSFVILGTTQDGGLFRPSDWADRLCGVMSSYQPEGVIATRLTYSPYVMPALRDGVRCVQVDGAIGMIEPMAYQFLRGFAADNFLVVLEGR
jgi:Protein of unknown function (DUF3579)